MLRLTIREALEKVDEEDIIAPFIYAYEDGDIIFYIGLSSEPFERLHQHIGKGTYLVPPDSIGSLILDNLPQSLDWSMVVYTLQELVPDRYAQVTKNQEYRWLVFWTMRLGPTRQRKWVPPPSQG